MADLNWKDAPAATAAQVRNAHTLFMIAAGSNQETPLKVPRTIMKAVFENVPTEIVEIDDASITGWHDTSAHAFADDDWVFVQLLEESGSYDTLQIGPMQFKNISTGYNRVGSIDGAPMNYIATVTSIPDENGNPDYKNLITDGANDQYLQVSARETAGENKSETWDGRFQDLPTSESTALRMLIGTSGDRFQLWRDGTNVRINRAGPINASNTASIFRAGKTQELRIRRTGTKLRYHLQGEISTDNKLRVIKL